MFLLFEVELMENQKNIKLQKARVDLKKKTNIWVVDCHKAI